MCLCKYEPNIYVHSVRIHAYIRVIVKTLRIAYIFFLFFAYATTQVFPGFFSCFSGFFQRGFQFFSVIFFSVVMKKLSSFPSNLLL
jgi:hypothetical protein